jgi:hypothetical protein
VGGRFEENEKEKRKRRSGIITWVSMFIFNYLTTKKKETQDMMDE